MSLFVIGLFVVQWLDFTERPSVLTFIAKNKMGVLGVIGVFAIATLGVAVCLWEMLVVSFDEKPLEALGIGGYLVLFEWYCFAIGRKLYLR